MLPLWLINAWASAAHLGASDLHLRAEHPGFARIRGALIEQPETCWPLPSWQQWLGTWLPNTSTLAGGHDARLEHPSAGAARVHLGLCQGLPSLTLRLLSSRIPSLRDMDMSPLWADHILQGNGLFLVTGATGSGKSSALAAWVAHWRAHHAGHVLSLEDPIELVHPPDQGLVTQREIGSDCASFADGLRAALRQDPDVIVIGELRDRETARLALQAAETGHVVLATLHTRDAIGAIDRLLALFPAEERGLAQLQLAACLRAVIAQTMTWQGPQAVFDRDVLLTTAAVRNAIREHRLSELANIMQTQAALGMRLRTSHGV